ncbi:acyl-CoA synthetase [Actinomycetospora chibensis]|uniref:Acyl-CoA synthetase n=1 Tax=Actinomycetospora chibensis TaxID=663606 RepID=A0ABV9RFR1_9PSEU|nr:acyl-CoA synthetase [Actinomycetospora chibensis]MDD7925073.1 acyl-CoA synthetase [Actinomycetospora chibensis]
MYPRTHAERNPDKVAARLVETGEELTYAALDERSTRLAHVLRDAGLERGDTVALLSVNALEALEVYWAGARSGFYVTAINHHLAVDEVAYIAADSGARALVVSADKAEIAAAVRERTPDVVLRLAYHGAVEGHDDYETALANASAEPLESEPAGAPMLYSSGTTGLPKGIRPPLAEGSITEAPDALVGLIRAFGVTEDTVYLSPAPMYHAAPLRWAAGVQAHGGTVVIMRKFDAEGALRAIAENGVTHGQFVPTMFVRMLKLDQSVRTAYDVSSLRVAVHAAAPCPVEVKQKMIDWWGPILVEYYAGTEAHGMTMIDSKQWEQKPGSVGKAVLGTLRICDDEGAELGVDEVGTVYFERERLPFVYHNDPEKTREAQHPQHENWTTVGDMGRVDEDGFLFLTDRKSFTIISGGVNIYPAEIESVLALHTSIDDVAVVGVPDEEMGEQVRAFVKAAADATPGLELEKEIIEFVRERIAHYKAPRGVEFVDSLPRTETGKLLKRQIRDDYLASTSAGV